ncbi:sensor histidine kinase [Nitrospira sp. T9]|uniref:sensor histidine kinase n=1 Tax=unclassified Nitrospira TaxID=2652172 RepID=UPI003F984CBB
MQEDKNQIVSGILKARAELEQVLYDLEKLPVVSESAVHFAAHALNNFLTVVGGTVELLLLMLAKHPDDQVRTGLEALKHATHLMTHTVSQMVNAETGRDATLRFEKVELPIMAQRFRIFYQRIADQKQIQCLSVAPADVPSVWTDRVATAAALDNLFSNAVKYSFPGKRIWVEVEPEQDWVVCRVRDEGPGLSPVDQAKLFQPGALLTPRPTAGELSTGYGLAVAKELIERVGGQIWCESVVGQGACFSFRLPQYRETVHGSGMTQSDPQEGKERRG